MCVCVEEESWDTCCVVLQKDFVSVVIRFSGSEDVFI